MQPLNFVILAAGKGTRMKNELPKVLHKICDKPLIGHVIATTKLFKANKNIFVTSPDVPEVDTYIRSNISEIEIIHQKERLGTGHAIKIALPVIPDEGYSVILYGDTPFVSADTINVMLDKLSSSSNSAVCILGFETSEPRGYGRLIVNQNNKLAEIVEEKEASEQQKEVKLCNSGVMVIANKHIKNLVEKIDNTNSKQEYYLTDIVKIARDQSLDVEYHTVAQNEVLGINSQSERAQAEKIRQNYLRSKYMEKGVILIAPETNFFSEEVEIAPGVEIHPYSIFKGKVKIAKGSIIYAYSYLEDCEVEERVNIGPYARLRPGTHMANESKVGNFVEIKNSKIGKGSKINHLSYIGDTEMGEEVNIGAGTVTCNYDGINKHKTKIQNNVFVGSNSSIIAPVTLAENSTLGAGTTLFENSEGGKVTINYMPLKTLDKK